MVSGRAAVRPSGLAARRDLIDEVVGSCVLLVVFSHSVPRPMVVTRAPRRLEDMCVGGVGKRRVGASGAAWRALYFFWLGCFVV